MRGKIQTLDSEYTISAAVLLAHLPAFQENRRCGGGSGRVRQWPFMLPGKADPRRRGERGA
jgi:hypothetical protein